MKKISELFSAFDYIDEIIYICDMETYDLVYCNQKTKEMLLSEYKENQPGYKCYKCLQGLDHPCVFCNNDALKKDKKSIWTRQNPHTGIYYLLHDRILMIDDKEYRLELAVDATHIEEAAAHTRKMLEIETHLTDCVRKLVKSGNLSNSVSAILQTILNFYAGERAYLFEYDWDKKIANNTYEICMPGITKEIDNLQNVPLEDLHFWTSIFKTQKALVIEDLQAVKDIPERKAEYDTLSMQNINSIIAVPVFSEDKLMGFIGVDNPKLNFGNSDFLLELAYFIGAELNKNRIYLKLKNLSYHDPLTGVYNRKGFEQIIENQTEDNLPIGFAMFDIDNFKMVNDTYGHDVGDEILKETANMLVSMLRKEDAVFRLGGDEFAVILYNCSSAAWKTLCSKIQWIHSVMAEKYKDKAITLSAGICFTEKRCDKRIFQLADEALYESKRNGRAGCTMIHAGTGEKKCWNDDNLSSNSRNLLEFNNMGLFRIEYTSGDAFPSMICSDMAKELFAFPSDANPQKCFELWMAGIDPSYLEALRETRRQLLHGVQAECTYQWNHPQYGKIFFRTTGIGENNDNVKTIYGFHHSLKDTRIVEREDDSKLLVEAISSIYLGSYFINLENDSYIIVKYGPCDELSQIHEKKASDSMRNFISSLVRSEDQGKMQVFADLQTLPERIRNEGHLDCEYVSTGEKGWCRASFIPVKYNAEGKVTHVLFEISNLDVNAARESEANEQNKKTIESLYNRVTGGLVLYEWDGNRFRTLQYSKFYEEQYGKPEPCNDLDDSGAPRIHPDDLLEYQLALKKALQKTNHLEHVYRAWNIVQNRYVWVKVNAVFEPASDGTSLVYALYSDVTGQKEAELDLRKKQATLIAALGVSNQLCYEYDPQTHIEECLTEDTVFHLPKVIKNYPDALLERNIIHPEDIEGFLHTIHIMEGGAKEANCRVRLKKNGRFVWFSCFFHLFYDTEKGRNLIILSIMDISEHIATVQNYQARMQMLLNMTKDALCFGNINLSKNLFSEVQALDNMMESMKKLSSLDDFVLHTAQYVVGTKQQEEYLKLFSRENLLDLMARGQLHVHMDHMSRMTRTHMEWVRTCVDMLKNPSTGDAVGVCYVKSIQNEQITGTLLEKTLQRDYPLAAVVLINSGEYYLFNAERGEYCAHKYNFWTQIAENLADVMDDPVIPQLQTALTKELVLNNLKCSSEYSYAFDCVIHGKNRRLEAKFNLMEENHEMLLATVRDITDSVIMKRLRYDNERDPLTHLYNRRKVYSVCRQLLKEHPEDQFAMLHFDIRHFRLYNTFFGDAAGDKLLCDIADMFRRMNADYDYWAYGRIESDVFCVFFPINHNKYQKHLQDLLHGLQGYRTDFLIEPAIGIYAVTDRSMSMESMFTRASIAAKYVKNGISSSVVFYDEAMEQALTDEQQVVNEMQTAIEQEQFQVYLQPKYSLWTNEPVGAEALVRWKHPQKGLIPPAKFIPVFERNGFIAALDRYMWEHVCQLLRKWKDAGYKLMPVSVNVSRISMYSPTTVQFLKELVRKYEIDPRYLELELTESAYMDDPDEMKKQLKELQKYGFHILMDDFGSGYSSLNTLRELPVDVLKLDMKFLSESSTDERGRLVLASVVRMSRMLQLEIIAEGVETLEQAGFLRGLGCEYAQGYLFSRPIPVSEYEQMLENTKASLNNKQRQGISESRKLQLMEEVFPAPAVRLEYQEGTILYQQVNELFLSKFNVDNDAESMTREFHCHVSGQEWNRFVQVCAQCAESKEQIGFKLHWIESKEKQHAYMGVAAYEGKNGNAARIITAFVEIME